MKRFIGITFLVAAVLMTAACSVKEDRSGLPSECNVDITAFKDHGNGFNIDFWDSSRKEDSFYKAEDEILAPFYLSVKRTHLTWSVTNAIYSGIREGGKLTFGPVPERLYADAGTVDASGELCYIVGKPYSQSAHIHIGLSEESIDMTNLHARVYTNAKGLDLESLAPISGSYVYDVNVNEDSAMDFYMFRQPDYGQKISFYVDDEEEPVYTILLGQELEKMSYRWDDRNVKDINIVIDITATGIRAEVLPWEEGKEDEYDL